MTSFSVSELGKNSQSIGLVNYLNYQLQDLQRQSSTGYKSDTFGGLGGGASQIALSLRSQMGALNTYQTSISNVALRTDTMNTALTSIPTDASDLLAKMRSISQGGDAVPNLTVLKDAASSMLDSLLGKLNTRVDGKYVFSGDQTGTAPIADVNAALTSVNTAVNAYSSGTPAATVITNLDSLTDANIGYASTIGAAGDVTARIDDGVTVNYTVKATESPFKDLITGLAMVVKMDYSAANSADFYKLFNNAISRIDGAASDINTRNGQLGIVRKQMADTNSTHSDTIDTVEANLSNVEQVDAPTVATKLTNLQTQMQAAYSIIAQFSQLSILNYLK